MSGKRPDLFQAVIVIVAVLVSFAGRVEAVPTLFGADGARGNPSTLFTIDPSTGAATPVGPIQDATGFHYAITGLAFDPMDGTLYGSTSRAGVGGRGTGLKALVTIDPLSGEAALVGDFGVDDQTAADISFGPDGTLYGWFENLVDDLYTIDTMTGQATLVGDSGLATAFSGLAVDSATTALHFDGGTISTLSLVTGGLLGTTPLSALGGTVAVGLGVDIDPDSGGLYALQVESGPTNAIGRDLVLVDPATGNVTVIGPTQARLDALAFGSVSRDVPEPASSTLLVLGLLAGALFRRERARR